VKYRIALAFFATSCMAGMSFAADLPVSGPYRPGPFMVRQPVEWTGFYFGANAGYGSGQYSSNITFTGRTWYQFCGTKGAERADAGEANLMDVPT
jgi:hypothetical protein